MFNRTYIIILLLIILFSCSENTFEERGVYQNYQPIADSILYDHSLHTINNEVDCKACHNKTSNASKKLIVDHNICKACHISELDLNIKENLSKINWKNITLPKPINFKHKLHVHLHGIDCKHCHSNEENKISSKINHTPSNSCFQCHEISVFGFISTIDSIKNKFN